MPKYDLSFTPPLMNAAGFLGFAPDLHGPVNLAKLGAFVTNPVSRRARSPARDRCYLPFPGGFLLHTGYPNPGIKAVIRRYAGRWRRSPLPVIVHLLAETEGDVAYMARRLEAVEGVMGIELGLPPEVDAETASRLIQAAQGELPVIARIPPERVGELARLARETGTAAISLGAPRGALPGSGGKTVQGRMYGPAVFPLAMAAVWAMARNRSPVGTSEEISLIGAGGVYSQREVESMLAAGAMAVQLDSVLWRSGWE